ncbi:hypothetical protein DDE83_000140 [Stemphylium lycopersici]|uniref:C2H2-type domain-containing protein n=1 Tax=Stemphylium lycopersici TaxID=183478 RepID=A0A364NHL0_STELY|nr:hypothetical protein DDE83_000140 [Stemphylium lycopersici]
MQQAWLALKDESEFTTRLEQPATEAMFYDPAAPSTVARRQRVRANFKMFCEVFYNETEETEMYAAETLTDRVCRFMEGIAKACKGKLAEKVKVSTLIQNRQSLEWWIRVLTPSFSTFSQEFTTRVSRHIHMIARLQNLSTENRKKNNLGEFELELFWGQIQVEQKKLANLKQHYVAWVLAFITGARPGSFTVSSRYRKGASMGGAVSASVPPRQESHTLRWSDVTFERMGQGISCGVVFRFNKGHQDPYRSSYVEGKREWFFPPKQQLLHLDLSLLLFLLAYERGLFKEDLQALLSGNKRKIDKREEINTQAVFVSADTKDMGYGALNPQLQEMCLSVGLLEYNNMYAFRREAATVTKHSKGLESAQELLNHVPSSKVAYIHYDPKGFGRRDTTAFRLGGPELSIADIRKYFSQASSLWKPTGTQKTATEEIKIAVEQRLLDNEEYAQLETTLEDILRSCHQFLQDNEVVAEEDSYGHSTRNVAKYRELLNDDVVKMQIETPGLLKRLNDHLAHRKTRRRDIRIALKKEVIETMKSDSAGQQQACNFNASDDDETDEDEDMNQDVNAGSNDEPDSWKTIEEDHILVALDNEGASTEDKGDTRATFIKEWMHLADSDLRRSKIKCLRCRLYPTMPQEAKDKEWILVKYNTHLKSEVHSRKSQLRRAFMIMQQENGKASCPLCSKSYNRASSFLEHVEQLHPEQLWLTKKAASAGDDEVEVEGHAAENSVQKHGPEDHEEGVSFDGLSVFE